MIIKMKKQLLFLFALIVSSCSTKVTLSSQDFGWMPYRENDTLIFMSNSGNMDTLYLVKKDTVWQFPEAQSIFGHQCEAVRVLCLHSDSVEGSQSIRYLENEFCSIRKNKTNQTLLNIRFLTKNATYYHLQEFDIDSLNKAPANQFKMNNKTHRDVYILEAEDYLGYLHKRKDYVEKLYWSKSKGLLRYDLKNGVYWELVD